MSKPTETTNERVPRDIVRIGTTVGKRGEHTEAWGNTRKRGEAHGWLAETRGTRGVGGAGSLGVKRYMFY